LQITIHGGFKPCNDLFFLYETPEALAIYFDRVQGEASALNHFKIPVNGSNMCFNCISDFGCCLSITAAGKQPNNSPLSYELISTGHNSLSKCKLMAFTVFRVLPLQICRSFHPFSGGRLVLSQFWERTSAERWSKNIPSTLSLTQGHCPLLSLQCPSCQ